ncbi:sugar phosphate isomerase/epimerase family protein [Aureibacillus halotolerans]|uniref:Sugar phosphate isomerase/epimerase n=1 Tax=Aureibacillus halotolerans TaxID=1508390 RepID=A0A4V6PWE2_9BACI|nr:sugar phosphate isomerase/epimerase family protein [Aureibacillus halotolerans]TDQ36427.1 sugar phosphate isomerase/epimerase [Aureibacillus halotolerans]
MKKALSAAGLGAINGPQHLIELAGKNGFEAVETSGSALLKIADEQGVETIDTWLREAGVTISTFGLAVEWRQTDEKFSEGLADLVRQAQLAKRLGVRNFCTYVLPATDMNASQFMAKAISRLRLCAQVLKNEGIQLGLEFVGPHHLRTMWKHPFIWTMEQMLDMVDAIDEPNVGLLLDGFHWYTTGATSEDIKRAGVDRIVHVHINDARNVPVEEVLDNDRLSPGEGVIDLTTFLQTLKDIGYEGAVAQEILTKEPPTEKPEVLAEKAKNAYEKIYATLS